MSKENMLTYLERTLAQHLEEYDFAIDWDAKNHTIEVIVHLFAENHQEAEIEDAAGVQSEESIIEFEDGFLLYNPDKSSFDEADYLKTLPYAGKKGIEAEVLDAVAIYLFEVLQNGESDLLDFLNEESIDTFELEWQNDRFAEILFEKKAQVISPNFLAYPSY